MDMPVGFARPGGHVDISVHSARDFVILTDREDGIAMQLSHLIVGQEGFH